MRNEERKMSPLSQRRARSKIEGTMLLVSLMAIPGKATNPGIINNYKHIENKVIKIIQH